MAERATRCGVIALVGAPNAGKSTLLNALVGQRLAAVTHKVQTTRARLLAVGMAGDSQMIFTDTPGIFQPRRRLDRAMVSAALKAAADADIVLLLVDAARKDVVAEARAMVDQVAGAGRPVWLALNKIDLLPRPQLLVLVTDLSALHEFGEIFMISALKEDGVGSLRDKLAAAMPEGPHLYPEDHLTDVPLRQLAAEITREKLFLQLHQELPYGATVETESWDETKAGSITISQVIHVARDTHKAMVLGKGGARIKSIGTAARREIEALVERKVNLRLFVKVSPNWQDDPDRYTAMGLDFAE